MTPVGSDDGAASWLPSPPYGYIPTTSASAAFVTVFGVSTSKYYSIKSNTAHHLIFYRFIVLHVVTAWRFRMWWLLPTVALTCVLELIGWGVRLWAGLSLSNSESIVAFWVQYVSRYVLILADSHLSVYRWCCLIVAPNFMMGAVVMIFSQLTKGANLSGFRRMKPRRSESSESRSIYIYSWKRADLDSALFLCFVRPWRTLFDQLSDSTYRVVLRCSPR